MCRGRYAISGPLRLWLWQRKQCVCTSCAHLGRMQSFDFSSHFTRYCNTAVCLSICLCVCDDIFGLGHARFSHTYITKVVRTTLERSVGYYDTEHVWVFLHFMMCRWRHNRTSWQAGCGTVLYHFGEIFAFIFFAIDNESVITKKTKKSVRTRCVGQEVNDLLHVLSTWKDKQTGGQALLWYRHRQ